MKGKDHKELAVLHDALDILPRISRALSNKPGKFYEATYLELSASEMSGGYGQGSNHYTYVPPAVGRKIIAAARKIIADEIKRRDK